MNPISPAADPRAINASIRQAVLQTALEIKQPIYSGSIVPANGNVLNIPIKNVGLVKGFLVDVTLTLSNSGAAAAALTSFGAANALSNVTFTDLDGYQRINAPGWLIHFLDTAKEGFPFGAALLGTALDTPISYGNNMALISATPSIGAGGTGTAKMRYWVPLAYSKHDLRGALFAGVVNATAYLALTVNPTPGVTAGDGTLAMYSGANTAVSITNATVNVVQVYLDQLPRYTSGPNRGAPILPPLDAMTQYRLMSTSLSGVTAGQDFPVSFSNFQEFLSLTCIYDQAGTLNNGSDINYFSLVTANSLPLFKLTPGQQGIHQRIRTKCDLPSGVYMFDFREQPINTNQSGNIQLNINPVSAAAGATVLAGFESFALVQSVLGAASLPAG